MMKKSEQLYLFTTFSDPLGIKSKALFTSFEESSSEQRNNISHFYQSCRYRKSPGNFYKVQMCYKQLLQVYFLKSAKTRTIFTQSISANI